MSLQDPSLKLTNRFFFCFLVTRSSTSCFLEVHPLHLFPTIGLFLLLFVPMGGQLIPFSFYVYYFFFFQLKNLSYLSKWGGRGRFSHHAFCKMHCRTLMAQIRAYVFMIITKKRYWQAPLQIGHWQCSSVNKIPTTTTNKNVILYMNIIKFQKTKGLNVVFMMGAYHVPFTLCVSHVEERSILPKCRVSFFLMYLWCIR